MKTIVHTVSPTQREQIYLRLRDELEREPGVRFAYLYGSMLESDRIHDVDVGLFLDETVAARKANLLDDLSVTLRAAVNVPVDIRVLNEAPLSFLYHVLRGRLLSCRDEAFLTDMMEDVARRYLDLASFLRISTKDAFAA
jgi:predicted nucleotidyltransferase